MRIAELTGLALLLALAGCSSSGNRTSISVDYYDVKGTTFDQVDQQIALHGPTVAGVGKAIAATSVRMNPDVIFRQQGNECRVIRANIKVQADVTLPRLSDRRKADNETQGAFSNIERYAKLHEAVHVAIADKHAEMAEKAILALPPEPSCPDLRTKAVNVFEQVMLDHRKAQLQFDADEQRRFRRARKST